MQKRQKDLKFHKKKIGKKYFLQVDYMRIKFLHIVLLVFISSYSYAQEAELKATVSKNKLGANQRLRIQFSVNKQGADNFKPPNFKNFRVIAGPSQSISQSMSWINGSKEVIFNKSFTYILKPLKKGEYNIPSASIEYQGKIIKSEPVKVIVLDPVDVPKDPNDPNYIAEQNIHLVAEISKSRPYIGEGIYVEYKLYVSQNVSVNDYSVTESPQYDGFWNQEIRVNGLPVRMGTYNGEQYRYVVLKKQFLIPTKSGRLSIDPMKMDVVIGVPTGRADFFGNQITRNVSRSFASAKKIIIPKELPLEGKPEDFSGAVGDFSFSVTSSRNTLKSNETALVSAKVKGKGNLKLFEIPEIKTPSELEVFTPEQREKVVVLSDGIKGSVAKEFTVVPQYKGKYKIPSVSFSYFNPRTKKYKTVTSEDLFIEVLEGKELVTNSDKNNTIKKDVVTTGKNFRYIQTKSSFVMNEQPDFYQSNLFYALLILPLVMIPAGILIAKRNEARNNDILSSKLRKADRLAKKYLSTAKKQIKNEDEFYIALEKALHNYLKAKLRIETSDISRDKISSFLAEKEVEQETISKFINVFDSCDLARYSPVTQVMMNEDYEKAKSVITQIDKHF